MKHCISLADFSADELRGILRTALSLKREPARHANLLAGRWLLMLFQKTSTRTRLSFETGMGRLGGHSVVMEWDKTNFAISPIEYEARYASGQVDIIMARLKKHEDTLALARYSRVPVINGCDDRAHPCQALADLLTVFEVAGTFEGQTLTYVGVHNNVSHSLCEASGKVGLKLILVTPEINPASDDPTLLESLVAAGKVERTLDLKGAARRSSFVYTDTWIDMEFYNDPDYQEEKKRRIALLQPYQLNAGNLAGSSAYIMHDMPIHPGFEISTDLVDSPRSLIYQQADNRTFAQQALVLFLLGITIK